MHCASFEGGSLHSSAISLERVVCFNIALTPSSAITYTIVVYHDGRCVPHHAVTLDVEEELGGRSGARFAKISGSRIH